VRLGGGSVCGECAGLRRVGVGVHALGRQDRGRRVRAGGRDEQGAAGEGVGPLVQGRQVGRGRGRGGAARRGAAAQPGQLAGEPLGRRVQIGGRCQRAQLVRDREQCREMTRELDVQLLLARPVGKSEGVRATVLWTDLVRIGSYMAWSPVL